MAKHKSEMQEEEMFTIVVSKVLVTTEKAWQIEFEDDGEMKKEWFPKSKCELNEETGMMLVPEWIKNAKKIKGK